MKKIFKIALTGLLFIDALLLIAIFIQHYANINVFPFLPGRRLNNPLAILLIGSLLWVWIDPLQRERCFSGLNNYFTPFRNRTIIFISLFLVQALLLAMHFIGDQNSHWDLDWEKGYGTYFSTLLLFLLAVLALGIARKTHAGLSPPRRHWFIAAFLFIYLAIDECIGIHDRAGKLIHQTFNFTQDYPLVLEWMWLYSPFILAATSLLVVFFWAISAGSLLTRCYLFSGLGFWVFAIGLEAFLRVDFIPWNVSVGMEEFAEMFGTLLLTAGFSQNMAGRKGPGGK